jgi:nucleotide-binding universal stress UspA family protein
VPSEEEVGMFEKILLAVDESDHSARAAELAGKLATLSNSEIVVLHVYEILPTRGGPVDTRVIESDVADEIATRLKDEGVNAHAKKLHAYHGLAANQIVTIGAENGVDLIVMGSRGLSDVAGMFLGSVAHKVLHLAKCPVLIAR